MKICSIEGCGQKHHANGLCCTHVHRAGRGQPVWTWREEFIRQNPPKDGIGLIPLTHGAVAIVDEDTYPKLMEYTWHRAVRGDVCTYSAGRKQLKMHRFIMQPPPDKLVDHVNLNPLDNRRSNLRLADKMQNAANSAHTRSPSGYRGVLLNPWSHTCRAYITINKKRHWIGPNFGSPERAALARDVFAAPLLGEFYRPSLTYDAPAL